MQAFAEFASLRTALYVDEPLFFCVTLPHYYAFYIFSTTIARRQEIEARPLSMSKDRRLTFVATQSEYLRACAVQFISIINLQAHGTIGSLALALYLGILAPCAPLRVLSVDTPINAQVNVHQCGLVATLRLYLQSRYVELCGHAYPHTKPV